MSCFLASVDALIAPLLPLCAKEVVPLLPLWCPFGEPVENAFPVDPDFCSMPAATSVANSREAMRLVTPGHTKLSLKLGNS
jgi:hypothetical protein